MSNNSAIISDCETFRYFLHRDVSDNTLLQRPALGCLLYVMLNPSTADANKDDRTIRKCKLIAAREGYGLMSVVNLFAYRATDPKQLLYRAEDPIGPANHTFIASAAKQASKVVVAWGSNKAVQLNSKQVSRVTDLLRQFHGQLWCLGTNGDGNPKHPLYLRNNTPLQEYLK